MSLPDHANELRRRILLSLAGIGVGAVVGWFLYDPVMDFIRSPLARLEGARTGINFQTIGAAFDLKLRVSLWIGLIVACPWWIYQIGAFVTPGLKRKEKTYAGWFGAVGIVLFLAGAASGVWLAPRAVEILQSFVPDGSYSLLQADSYVTFYMRLVVAFGISFLVPELLVALNFAGVLSSRAMLKAWRWAVVGAFGFAAVANPLPSPWPMVAQAMVLVGLYVMAVGISWVSEKYRAHGRRLRPTGARRRPGA